MSGPHDAIDPTDDSPLAGPSDMELEMLAALRENQTEAFTPLPFDGLMAQFRELNQASWSPRPAGERVRYLGDYELIEELGRGRMGMVYSSRQLSLRRDVAVKMVLAAAYALTRRLERFRTESEATAKLHHPNIVPVYEVGEHEGQPYFSMRLISGTNLAAANAKWRIDFPTLEAAARRERSVQRCWSKLWHGAIHRAHQHAVLPLGVTGLTNRDRSCHSLRDTLSLFQNPPPAVALPVRALLYFVFPTWQRHGTR